MQRCGGIGALRSGNGDVGEVEVIEHINDTGACVLMINSPAIGFVAVGIEREVGADVVLCEFVESKTGATDGIEPQLACDDEHGIAQFFSAEAARREAPKQAGGFVSF